MNSAEGRLLLLGEKECQRCLRAYGELVGKLNELNHQTATDAQMRKVREDLLEARGRFFENLSKAYRG